jgi:hypothetical protein
MHRARGARTRGFDSSTSNARLEFSMFSKPSYFCMWKFVWADKPQLALSAPTNFHIQKCNTFRESENPSRTICSRTMVQYGTAVPLEELGTAVPSPRYCLLDGTKFSTKFSLCVLQYTAVLNLDSIDLKTGLVQLRYYILCETK